MKSVFTLISIVILHICLSFLAPNQSPAQSKDTSETKSPPSNNYYLKAAKMHFELKDYAKAIDTLELAILLEPDNTETLALLKESRRLLEGKKDLTRDAG